jgi:hypothetical protein
VAALTALDGLPAVVNYRGWMTGIRELLPSQDFPDQHPQLDGSRWQKGWTILQADT